MDWNEAAVLDKANIEKYHAESRAELEVARNFHKKWNDSMGAIFKFYDDEVKIVSVNINTITSQLTLIRSATIISHYSPYVLLQSTKNPHRKYKILSSQTEDLWKLLPVEDPIEYYI